MRRVIVIGASSGIGKRLAEYYAQIGCKVAIAARRVELLKEIEDEYPNNIIYSKIDVSDSVQNIEYELNNLIERLGGMDLLIYSSGAGRQCLDISASEEISTTKVNVDGFLTTIDTAFNFFKNKGNEKYGTEIFNYHPQIVVISSIAGTKGLGMAASYSASKRFQINYMQALNQLANKIELNINLTCIMPGFIRTDFINNQSYPLTMDLDYASNLIIKAIENKKRFIVIDWRWQLIALVWKLTPNCLISKIIKKLY